MSKSNQSLKDSANVQVNEPKQYLDASGKLIGDIKHIKLSKNDHKKIFEAMLKVRLFEDRCMKLQRQGRIGFYIGSYGQEASHIASAFALKTTDWFFATYRALGVMFLREAPLQAIVDQLFGNADDNTGGAQMPCHHSFKDLGFVSISSPIGTQIPQATGTAMAMKYRGDGNIAFAQMGDGGTSEGDFHVALNFAGVYKAPVIFFVEDNKWAISCPSSEQTASSDYASKAIGYGMEGIRVDGNDVFAVYEAAKYAADKARNGGGPTLIESVTYRLFSHSSSDDASKYCPQDEYDEALKREPMIRYRKYLEKEKIWTQKWEDELSETFKNDVQEAIKKAEAKPKPDTATLFENVYKESHPMLDEQKRVLEEELEERSSWDDDGSFPL